MKETKKIRLYKWIVPIAVLVIFVLIELLIRITVPPADSSSEIDLAPLYMFNKIEKKDGTWFQIIGNYNIINKNILFREIPEPGVFRVFILGGSAAQGWPHPPNETFSYYLEKTLNRINPSRKTEVINCAVHGYASYRVLQVFEQIKKFHPDLIIVWCGNNEFLEERSFNDNNFSQVLRRVAGKIRTVQVLNKLIFPPAKLGRDLNVAGTFWKKTRKEALSLRADEKKYANVRKIYTQSISQIVGEAKEKGIQVMLMTVPVNLRDWQPNVAKLNGSKKDSIIWYNHFFKGRGFMLKNQFDSSYKEFKLASKIQPENADSWFWMGKAAEQLEDTINAYVYFKHACDLDMNPFRAVSAFNDSLRSIALKYEILLFDAEKILRRNAQGGIPGFDLFLDYVHPSKSGNIHLCAEAAEIINNMPQFNAYHKTKLYTNEIRDWFNDGYSDNSDFLLQTHCFSLCCLTHQYNSAIMIGNKILQQKIPENFSNQEIFDKLRLGIDAFQHRISVDEKLYLNEHVSKDEVDLANKKMNEFYNTFYPYGTF